MTAFDLKVAVKALNDSGLVEKKIIHVGKKMVDVENTFVEAVEGIPDEKEKEIPDVVLTVFNELVKKENQAVEKEIPSKKAKAEKKKAVKKEVKEGKAEVEVTKDGRKMWRKGTSAQLLMDAVIGAGKKGISKEGLTEVKFDSDNKQSRVFVVMREAIKRGLVKKEKDLFFFV